MARLTAEPLDGGGMISRFIAWWKSSRAWSADHRATWPTYTALVDGKSRLMSEAEEAIRNVAASEGFSVGERVEEAFDGSNGKGEKCVRFKLEPTNVEVWLYSDGAQLDAPLRCQIFEEWDFRTPQDFVEELSASAIAMAKSQPAV